MANEIWKDVKKFKGHYQASNFGRVRSIKKEKPLILKPLKHTGGYHAYVFWVKGYPFRFFAHRLILETFVGKAKTKQQGCHNNGDKKDNRLENLRWDTSKNNHRDREKHGKGNGVRRGAKFATLNPVTAKKIRKTYAGNITQLAKKLKLPRTTVADVINRRTWA